MSKEAKTRSADAPQEAAQSEAVSDGAVDNAANEDASRNGAPGWDAKEIHRIAREHYGGLEQMFAHHEWPQRGNEMMTSVQENVAAHYGTVEKFVHRHKNDVQSALSPEELIAKLQQAQAENAEARDGLLRARAEVENIRRRSQNEINAARKFAIESFAKELLGVRDSLDRAAAVTLDENAAEPVAQMKKGLGLTLEQFDSALARFAVVEVAAAPGAPFDPECHQAISTAASDEIAPDHIISVVQKGFLLKERLLRPAMVVVAKA